MGLNLFTQEELDSIVEKAHNNGMQLAIHSIGNRAMYMVFEAMEKALRKKNQEKKSSSWYSPLSNNR